MQFAHVAMLIHAVCDQIRDAMEKCSPKITAVAFPDEGAQKRFGKMFPGIPSILCGKTRVGDTRQVVVQDGDPLVSRSMIAFSSRAAPVARCVSLRLHCCDQSARRGSTS